MRSEHGALQWHFNFYNPESQIVHWLEALGTYTLKTQHRPERSHGNADALSCRPCEKVCKHCLRLEEKYNSVNNRPTPVTAATVIQMQNVQVPSPSQTNINVIASDIRMSRLSVGGSIKKTGLILENSN